jgi:hypothetical protein
MGMDPNYNRTGGANDIALLTATMYSALLMIKKAGIEVPQPMLDRAHDNLSKLLAKGGLMYGTGNKSPDWGLCRVATAFIGLKIAGMTSSPIYSAAGNLPAFIQKTQDAHAFGPTNFLGMSIALQLQGGYAAYANYWLPKLAAIQKEDGTLQMMHDGNRDTELAATANSRVSSAAVFNLMILMQKHKLIEEPPRGGAAPAKSAFSQK